MKHFILSLLCIAIIFGASAQNQNISNGNFFEGEPFIAVNPTNPQNIVVSWMGFNIANGLRLSIKVKSSFNGGATWSAANIIPHVVSTYKSADPSMVFDNQGNLFLCFIDYRENPDSGGVYLMKSTDGGLNFGAPLKILDGLADGTKLPIDRPWLAMNNTGDKLYVTTKPAPWIPAPNRPYFISSVDSGKTWSNWRYIDTTGFLVGNLIAAPMAAPAASGSRCFAAYPSYLFSQNVLPQYILATTNNNGATFSYSSIISGSNLASNDSAKLAYNLLVNPADSNHIVFIYPYKPSGDNDILMTESFNSGTTWTTPIRINDDPIGNGKMQDMIWADFDSDGDLVISWRDRRNAAGNSFNVGCEFYAAFRDHDSTNFAPNIALSDSLVSYNNIISGNGNDFMGIDITNDTISAVWGNTNDGSLDIWFTRIAAKTGQTTSVSLIESASNKVSVYPNPSAGIYIIEMIDKSIIDEIIIYSAEGKNILHKKGNSSKIEINLEQEPRGVYLIYIKSNGKTITKKIIK